MQAGRHDPVLQRQRRFQEPGHAGRRLQMPDVAFDRANRQRLPAALAESLSDRGGLYRVARRGAGAVHFEEGQIVRRDTRFLIDRADQAGLRRLARQRHADRAAIGIDPRTGDDAAYPIAIGQRLPQRLQNNRGAALAAHIAVGAFVESKAAAALRQHRRAAKADERVGRQQQVDPAHDSAAYPLGANRLASLMQRDY